MSRRSRRARAPPAHPAPPPRPSLPDASALRAAAARRPLPRGSPVSRKSCLAAPPSCRPRARRLPARAVPPSSPFLGPAASHIPRVARPARGSHPLQAAPRETRARSSRAAGVGAGIRSPGRSLLEDQGDGSVIHELHLHHRPELSRGDLHPAPCSPLPHERDKAVVERNRNLRRRGARSEEHTSELQSHSDLVCRLLLEKKNRQLIVPNRGRRAAPTALDTAARR